MAGELVHKSVGTELTQAEFEALDAHTIDGAGAGTVISGKVSHSLITAINDFLVGTGVGVVGKKTLAETKVILGLNVSATDKLLGRSSAGAGDIEEIACTADIRTLLSKTVAQGDMIYGSAINTLAMLTKGAANAKLFMNAAGTLPEWASGVKIGSFTRDIAGANGNVAYTGAGFKPSVIVFIGAVGNTKYVSMGFAAALNQGVVFSYATPATWGGGIMNTSIIIHSGSGGGGRSFIFYGF